MLSKMNKGKKNPKLSEDLKRQHKSGKRPRISEYYSSRGLKRSEESKEKQRISMKGKVPWNKGIPRSEETKNKIRDSLLTTLKNRACEGNR